MPSIRSDIVDLYIFRRAADAPPAPSAIELLQLLRAGGLAAGAWHPVMGHIHEGETSIACVLREMREEVGLVPGDHNLLGLWGLEQIHPFFVPQWDAVVLSPRFCAEVAPAWQPTLNQEHSSFRWTAAADAHRTFLWPGQLAAVLEIMHMLGNPHLLNALRVDC